MTDILISLYPWTKALHIVAVIAWMAGLFYLPRLYVYHTEQVELGSRTDDMFKTMERRLLKAIMNPSMIVAWVFGLALVLTPGITDCSLVWPWAKGIAVILMTWFHMWLAARRKDFAAGTNTLPGKRYRMMNEFPTLLMLVIVFAVIVKF